MARMTRLDSVSARRQLMEVQERLNCPVCLQRYQDPRMLDCHHTFCRGCLGDIASSRVLDPSNPFSEYELTCPNCREVTRLGAGGVATLTKNYQIGELMDVVTPLDFSESPPPPPDCERHPRRPLDYFCKTCDILICANCIIKLHRSHEVEEAAEILRREITNFEVRSLEPAENALQDVNVAIASVDNMHKSFKEKMDSLHKAISLHFSKVRQLVTRRENALLTSVEKIIAKKKHALSEQKSSLERAKQQLENVINRIRWTVANEKSLAFLKTKATIISDVEKSVDKARCCNRTPVETIVDGPEVEMPNTLEKATEGYGSVYCKPCPKMFAVSGDGCRKAFLKMPTSIMVQARDNYGERSFSGKYEVQATVFDTDGRVNTTVCVKGPSKGEHSITYTPMKIGVHTVKIAVDGEAIRESQVIVFNDKDYAIPKPLNEITRQHINKFPPEPAISQMKSVCSIPNTDCVIFADMFCLRAINLATGQILRTIGSYGNWKGQFMQPSGLVMNSQGEIFASDAVNNRVEKFSNDGHYIASFPPDKAKLALLAPEGLAVVDDKLYVVDRGNNRIQIFLQKNGKPFTPIGQRGSEPGMFESPRDIAIDATRRRLLVADSGNSRIQALSCDNGRPISTFGIGGCVKINSPTSIAVDPDGFIFVTDTRSQIVYFLSPEGTIFRRLGDQRNTPNSRDVSYRSPYGVCVTDKKQLVVTDSSVHFMHVF